MAITQFIHIVIGTAPFILRGAVVTIELILLVMLISTTLALPVALARNARRRWIAIPIGVASWAARGLPPLVILFFAYFGAPRLGLSLDPFPAAVIGMSAYMTFYLAEAIRSGLAAVPGGQYLAVRALAIGPLRAFFRVILPQALPAVIPPYINYTTEIVKDSALAGAIAVPEMMGNASQLILSTGRPFQILLFVAFLYAILDAALIAAQAVAERRWLTHQAH